LREHTQHAFLYAAVAKSVAVAVCGSGAAAHCDADCDADGGTDIHPNAADEHSYVATYCCTNIETHADPNLHSWQAHPNTIFHTDLAAYSASIVHSYPKAFCAAVCESYPSSVGSANSAAYNFSDLLG
jgi:hypothetical protein